MVSTLLEILDKELLEYARVVGMEIVSTLLEILEGTEGRDLRLEV